MIILFHCINTIDNIGCIVWACVNNKMLQLQHSPYQYLFHAHGHYSYNSRIVMIILPHALPLMLFHLMLLQLLLFSPHALPTSCSSTSCSFHLMLLHLMLLHFLLFHLMLFSPHALFTSCSFHFILFCLVQLSYRIVSYRCGFAQY